MKVRTVIKTSFVFTVNIRVKKQKIERTLLQYKCLGSIVTSDSGCIMMVIWRLKLW